VGANVGTFFFKTNKSEKNLLKYKNIFKFAPHLIVEQENRKSIHDSK